MEKTFLQALNLYRAKSALQISPSPELALVFVSLAPAIPGMENKDAGQEQQEVPVGKEAHRQLQL